MRIPLLGVVAAVGLAAQVCLAGDLHVGTNLGFSRIFSEEDLPGTLVEIGLARTSGYLVWGISAGMVGANQTFQALPGTVDSARFLEPFPMDVTDPQSFYEFVGTYYLAFRIGPAYPLGPILLHGSAGLLPNFTSQIHADTAYVPSETIQGKSIFIHEYFLDRYFGLGAEIRIGADLVRSGWLTGIHLTYSRWAKLSGVSMGIHLGYSARKKS